jgi:hypothetical protein
MVRVMKIGKAGELAAYEEMAKITNRPANLLDNRDQRSGVAVLDPNAVETSKREEAFRGVLVQKFPGIKWSERTFHIYLNKLRTEVLDSLVGQLEKMTGRKATDAELKVLGNYINIASGRGSWGKYNTALDAASKVLWSPRLLTSRLEFLMGQPLVHNLLKEGKLPEVRALIAKEYAQSAGGLATLLSLGLAGAKIEIGASPNLVNAFRVVRIDPFAGCSNHSSSPQLISQDNARPNAGKSIQSVATCPSVRTPGTVVRLVSVKRPPWEAPSTSQEAAPLPDSLPAQ